MTSTTPLLEHQIALTTSTGSGGSHTVNTALSNSLQEMALCESISEGPLAGDPGLCPGPPAGLPACHAGPGQPGGGGDAGALRRRRASMQDAIDLTKFNASLYERPVRDISHITMDTV